MKLTEKTERYSTGRKFVGKYKKWECNINYHSGNWCDENEYWWFYCSKDDNNFNSLWKKLKYNSKEECHDACVEYINKQEGK